MSTGLTFIISIIIIFIQIQSLPSSILAFTPVPLFNNASLISLPPPPRNTDHILQDVLKAISVRQNWDLDDLRVSKLDARSARFGSAQRYEFRIRFGKSHLFFRFSDLVVSWKKLRNGRSDLGHLVDRVGSLVLLDGFKVEGPFELQVGGNDQLSLSVPLTSSVSGLKRIQVGEGITVEVKRAQEVSMFHPSDFGIAVNSSHVLNEEKRVFWPSRHSWCSTVLPIRLKGSASVVAYHTRSPDANIESKRSSKKTIELLSEKCYDSPTYKKRACPIISLSSKITAVKRILRSLGNMIHQDRLLGPLKAKMKASTIIKFQLELERDIRSNDTAQSTLAEWRTSPTVERVLFEVLARVEGERLKPLKIKNVRPFLVADTTAWSNIMSNISFTKFPPILVPPEALTLDVK